MKIALLHNPRPPERPAGMMDDHFEEFDGEETIEAIQRALREMGAEVEPIVADRRLPWRLEEGRFDFAFNIAEGHGRRCREAVPAAVCELLGLPYSGSDPLTLAAALDKWMARRIVSPDVPVANGILITHGAKLPPLDHLHFPVIVKPNDEGSSKGIRENPVAGSAEAARERVRWLWDRYHCPVLVEEFLSGAEVTVGILGNGSCARILGIMEIAPIKEDTAFVYSLEIKRDYRNRVAYHNPPRLDPSTIHRIESDALVAFELLGCRDLARVDFRLDRDGRPRFIECNPLPGLHPRDSDLVILSRPILSHQQLVQGIFRHAAARHGLVSQ